MKNKKKKRKRQTRQQRIIVLRLKITGFFLAAAAIAFCVWQWDFIIDLLDRDPNRPSVVQEEEPTKAPAPPESEGGEETPYVVPDLAEESIYTFLQGPVAWNSRTPWSGSWCDEELAGQKFSVFGCGHCDLANIYSTLSPYECSPVDMYYYAKEASGYTPRDGFGAIDWPYLKETLESAGFSCEICDKDETYEEFRDRIAGAVTAIVLVSSYDDDTYWQDTEGHYVNIWSFDPEREDVFLADSGNPEHNRSRVPLEMIYSSLKTVGQHQYLLVRSYSEEKNGWKKNGISEDWTIPDYYTPKTVDERRTPE